MEVDAALRLLLSGHLGTPGEAQKKEFLGFARQRGVDPADFLVAVEGGLLWWALLPAVSPGRTVLLLSPSLMPAGPTVHHAKALTEVACGMMAAHGVRLAQLLLDTTEPGLIALYESCGFSRLAELVYLRRDVRQAEPPPLPDGVELVHYDTQSHGQFRQALAASYEGSLDCPALNGRRELDDILLGHRGAGEFDPSWWTLLRHNGRPAGVLLMSAPPGSVAAELVYIGLAPPARGKGLGELLMRVALATVSRAGMAELMLAVDSINAPALALYQRFGMRRVTSRIAMMRDLAPGAPALPHAG